PPCRALFPYTTLFRSDWRCKLLFSFDRRWASNRQVSYLIDDAVEARRYNDGRVILFNNDWTNKLCPNTEFFTFVEPRIDRSWFAFNIEGHRTGLDQGRFESTGGVRQWSRQFVHHGRGIDADVNNFDGAVFELVAKLFQVGRVECLLNLCEPLVINLALRYAETNFITLAFITGIGEPFDFASILGNALRIQPGNCLCFELFVGFLN